MIIIFFVFILVVIIIYVIARNFDRDRIKEEIESRGGKLLSKEWSPFGKGWAGEESDRIYKVVYRDKEGNIHKAFVKTSMLSGVYFSQDEITTFANHTQPHFDTSKSENKSLQLENENLKREIEELKKQR